MNTSTNKVAGVTGEKAREVLSGLIEDLRLSENEDEARGLIIQALTIAWMIGEKTIPDRAQLGKDGAEKAETWKQLADLWNDYVKVISP